MRRSWPILIGAVLLAGCPVGRQGQPQNVTPVTTVAPQVDISGKLDTLEQKITTVQETVTNSTQVYALDEARAELAKQASKDQRKLYMMIIGTLVGFTLLCLSLNSPIPEGKRWLAVVASFAVIVCSIGIPLLLF